MKKAEKEVTLYKDIEIGSEIPPSSERMNQIRLVMYCGATWDFARNHYDLEFIRRMGFDKQVIDPQMYGAFFTKMLANWATPSGRLKKLKMSYRSPGYVGDTLTLRAKVTKKYIQDTEKLINCDLLLENQNKDHLVEGAAVILFF